MYRDQNSPLVSVIIPVYNVEKYLKRCVQTVICQTYSNLEIILVDDGSTDQSGKLCDELMNTDSRIQVIHKINGGLSDARNVGIEKASGEYITFLDSDDYIAYDFIQYLLSIIMENDVELSYCNSISTKEDTVFKEITDKIETIKLFTKYEAFKRLCYQKEITHSVCGKLYNIKLFSTLRFPIGRLYEDEDIMFRVLDQVEIIGYSSIPKYAYFLRMNGIVRSDFNVKKMDYITHTENFVEYIKKNYPDLEEAVYSKLLWSSLHMWVQIPDTKIYNKEYNYIKKIVKKYRLKTLLNKEVRKKNKSLLLLSFFGQKIMRLVYISKARLETE